MIVIIYNLNLSKEMLDSRFSTVKSVAYSDFSSIQASSAPGFVPIPCPSHTEYAITNICKSPSCL